MTAIDVADLKPVGEFGSRAWCEACASYGVQLLEDGFVALSRRHVSAGGSGRHVWTLRRYRWP